jgi:hypothetical protein
MNRPPFIRDAHPPHIEKATVEPKLKTPRRGAAVSSSSSLKELAFPWKRCPDVPFLPVPSSVQVMGANVNEFERTSSRNDVRLRLCPIEPSADVKVP